MAKQASKTGKTYASVLRGVNLKAVAVSFAEQQTANQDAAKMMRATAAQAMLECGKACAKTGDVESVNLVAYWYASARVSFGIAEGTAKKEASQLRQVCRACMGGAKIVKKLDENDTLYSHEFAALAKKITPAKFRSKSTGGGATKAKSKVTDKEFARMVKWTRLLSDKQRAVIETIFAKMDGTASGKVTDITSQISAKRGIVGKRKAA